MNPAIVPQFVGKFGPDLEEAGGKARFGMDDLVVKEQVVNGNVMRGTF